MSWAFHLKNFVVGQGLKPTTASTTDSKALATWSKENAKVVTWMVNSFDPFLVVALHAYIATSDMWAHLKKIYHQTNKAQKFHLDSEIAKYSQGDKFV